MGASDANLNSCLHRFTYQVKAAVFDGSLALEEFNAIVVSLEELKGLALRGTVVISSAVLDAVRTRCTGGVRHIPEISPCGVGPSEIRPT